MNAQQRWTFGEDGKPDNVPEETPWEWDEEPEAGKGWGRPVEDGPDPD